MYIEDFEITKTAHHIAKIVYCITFLFFNQIFTNNNDTLVHDSYHLHTVFSSAELKEKFSNFLSEVLKQVSPKKFYGLIDEIEVDNEKKNDQEIYAAIVQKIGSIKPTIKLFAQLNSLNNQKKVLGNQALVLLSDQKKINGCVEIGTPGTYATTLSKSMPFTGKLYSINDKKSWTDSFQAFSYNPIKRFTASDVFISLNNYDSISKTDIPDNSVDLILCFIGLHHIPLEKIDNFISSIYRILRPGGVFLLRDHDCHNAEIESIIFTAHSVYNALVTSEPLENELSEFRNFQKLDHWIELLEKHGFQADNQRLLQHNDPTLNTMIKFRKMPITDEEKIITISNALKTEKDYVIDPMQTHLTSAEWFNVDASQEYGKFIEHTPFYEFPYLTNVGIYWKIFKNSWRIAQAKQGTLALMASPYTLMSLFVGVFMSIEYGAKALVSWPIRSWYSGEKPMPIKILINDPHNQIDNLDKRIKILNHYPNTSFVLIEMPRNKEFFQIIETIENTNIILQEIAGQKEIQIKVLQEDNQGLAFVIDGCKQEYSWKVPTKPNQTFLALTIEVTKLKQVFKELKQQGIHILHIHDF